MVAGVQIQLQTGTPPPKAHPLDPAEGWHSGILPWNYIENGLYDVKAWGAKGDNVTDDQPAIQGAINSAHDDGGGIVYFPPLGFGAMDRYKITEPIYLKDGVSLLGAHAMASRISFHGSDASAERVLGIVGDEPSHFFIKNLTLGFEGFYNNVAAKCIKFSSPEPSQFIMENVILRKGYYGLYDVSSAFHALLKRVWAYENRYGFYKGMVTVATITRARASNVATIGTATPHGMGTGTPFSISGLGGTGYNGTYAVASVPDSTHFTYANTGSDELETADTGGTVAYGGGGAYHFDTCYAQGRALSTWDIAGWYIRGAHGSKLTVCSMDSYTGGAASLAHFEDMEQFTVDGFEFESNIQQNVNHALILVKNCPQTAFDGVLSVSNTLDVGDGTSDVHGMMIKNSKVSMKDCRLDSITLLNSNRIGYALGVDNSEVSIASSHIPNISGSGGSPTLRAIHLLED